MDGQAAHFTLQGAGPFLHWLTFGILCLVPIVVGFVLYKLGGLPGAIARKRNHPQADAINVCGWMGIITIVLWPVAMVWAHLVPHGQMPGASQPAVASQSWLERLRQATDRLAALEAKLS